MIRAAEIVSRIEELGGFLALDGDESIRYRVPRNHPESQDLLEVVRSEKQNLLAYLRARQAVPPKRPAPDDLYSQLAQRALAAICEDYPEGYPILWAERAAPDLYDDVTSRLPDLISKLWNQGVSIERFQAVLDEWVSAHHRLCQLYRSGECKELRMEQTPVFYPAGRLTC